MFLLGLWKYSRMAPMTGVLQRRDTDTLRRTGKWLERMELCLAMDEEPIECLWVRIKERAGKGNIIVCLCYRPPDQE